MIGTYLGASASFSWKAGRLSISVQNVVKMRILLIESDVLLRSVLSEAIIEAGHEPLVWKPQESPLEQIWRTAPDLVVLDLTPASDETMSQFLQALVADERARNLPYVVMVADPQREARYQALLRSLSYQVLVKPFELEELLAAFWAARRFRERSH
jgi:DNA-binding response OmpR family regulator